MDWKPTLTWQNAQKRASVLQQVRQFFYDRNVVEVETPALSQSTVTDVHLDALSCRYNFLADSPTSDSTVLYLQTSPEFHMKRLLASGYGCIFQISKAFRHEEYGKYHNPEFTMLEWYRIGFTHFELMAEVSDLLSLILNCNKPTIETYQNVFINHVGIDPLITSKDDLISLIDSHDKLSDWLIEQAGVDVLLQFIFSEIIEPNIGKEAPCFVYNFPRSQASLANICTEDNRVAQRFECYFQGVELVNGFNELTDSDSQLARFLEDKQQRKKLGMADKSIDDNFISALSHGLPKCSGVALGIDRLIMLALKAPNINQVISFPVDSA